MQSNQVCHANEISSAHMYCLTIPSLPRRPQQRPNRCGRRLSGIHRPLVEAWKRRKGGGQKRHIMIGRHADCRGAPCMGSARGRVAVQQDWRHCCCRNRSGPHLHSPGQVGEFSVPALRRLGGPAEFRGAASGTCAVQLMEGRHWRRRQQQQGAAAAAAGAACGGCSRGSS